MSKLDATRIERSLKNVHRQYSERLQKLVVEEAEIVRDLRAQCSHIYEDGTPAVTPSSLWNSSSCLACGFVLEDDFKNLFRANQLAADADLGPAALGDVVMGMSGMGVEPMAADPEVPGHSVQIVDTEGSTD